MWIDIDQIESFQNLIFSIRTLIRKNTKTLGSKYNIVSKKEWISSEIKLREKFFFLKK